jgi:hypothetical protein
MVVLSISGENYGLFEDPILIAARKQYALFLKTPDMELN